MPGSLAPDRSRGAWSINHHHSRTRPRWLPPARRRPRGGTRQASPARWVADTPSRSSLNAGGHQSVHACQQRLCLCVACLPHTAPCAHLDRPPPGWPARPPGRPPVPYVHAHALVVLDLTSCMHPMHLARAPMPSPAGATYASRSDPSPLPPPPPYYLTHAGTA